MTLFFVRATMCKCRCCFKGIFAGDYWLEHFAQEWYTPVDLFCWCLLFPVLVIALTLGAAFWVFFGYISTGNISKSWVAFRVITIVIGASSGILLLLLLAFNIYVWVYVDAEALRARADFRLDAIERANREYGDNWNMDKLLEVEARMRREMADEEAGYTSTD